MMEEAVMANAATGTEYEVVIGLEVHAQLLTASKMFCRCSASYITAGPNENTCPVCLGMPGVLPVMNEEAIRDTILTGIALGCTIPEVSKFDRKNYFYADLPKGYQISQFDQPLTVDGTLRFVVDGKEVSCGIERVHLEEDAGTLHHLGSGIHSSHASLVDFNRAGVPLMEIVGRPDLRTPKEAREYVTTLRRILMFIGVNDGNLEEGSMRCDANISLRPKGATELGAKVEVKNMNSFRSIERALEHEIVRQTALLRRGETIPQETRGWIDPENRTVSQRSKEQAHDYRYFPDPDLPALSISRELVDELRRSLPELPSAMQTRFVSSYGISEYEAGVLTQERSDAETFEEIVKRGVDPVLAARWCIGDLAKLAKDSKTGIGASGLGVEGVAELLKLLHAGTINGATAKALAEELYTVGGSPAALVAERGLGKVSDRSAVEAMCQEAIAGNQKAVEDFRGGKEAAFQSLVGAVMKASRGRADAALVREVLTDLLSS
ncbi:MAG: Asp-tRNA(Asn)/Glu-tRNA(Gln) amidotransferase subunit GatB [Candidatus Dormibacteria bacterium]